MEKPRSEGVKSDTPSDLEKIVGRVRHGRPALRGVSLAKSTHSLDRGKMDTSITVQVFDWRGELWLTVDRLHRHGGRRYAPRDRLATFHVDALRDVSEDEALLWLHEQLAAWVAAGCPRRRWTDRVAVSAPPGGGHGGRRVATATRPGKPLPSKTAPPPLEGSGAAGVSDGLKPPGVQGLLLGDSEIEQAARAHLSQGYTR